MSETEDSGGRLWPLAVVLAWALPGLGHWYLGRRVKALVFLVLITGLFLSGWQLGGRRVVDRDDTLPFMAQVLVGGAAFATAAIGEASFQAEGPADPVGAAYQSGLVYTYVAGLLNLLVMLDAYIVANNIRRPTHPEPETTDDAAAAEGEEGGR